MKSKFYLAIIVLALAGFTTPRALLAADDKPAEKPATTAKDRRAALQDRMKQVALDLKLTDEQKEKLRPVIQEQAKKVREIRQGQDLSREDKLAKFKEIREATREKLKPILTAEQLEKWDKIRQTAGNRRQKEE